MNELKAYKGTLPYASELFGVYQPFLGWRGKQAQQRLYKEQRGLAAYVARGMSNDSRVQQLVKDQQHPVSIMSPDTPLPPKIPAWLQSVAANHVELAVEDFIGTNQRTPTNGQEWRNILDVASTGIHAALNVHSSDVVTSPASASKVTSPAALAMVSTPDLQTLDLRLHESLVFGMLDYLNRRSPEALKAIFAEYQKPWQVTKDFMNPLEGFDGNVQNAVLSPIGLITLYREYFFDCGTFLGPPVDNIWVSPGGSVEVFEVHTRKSIVDKQVETATEVTTRTEVTTTTEDELSDACKKENQESDKLATSASGGVNFGVWGAEGSTNYETNNAHSSAEETTHKVLRQQSEKQTNEIRRSFKTTFKTTLETEDTFSRRYVIQNTTDKLANYLLRRLMREICVQVQHIGTQLCWQVYIDNPGDGLAIADLVHVAKPEDMASGIQPPEAPPTPQPKQTTRSILFDFLAINWEQETDDAHYYIPVPPDQLKDDQDEDAHRILAVHDYTEPPPAPDYALTNVNIKSPPRGTNPDKDPPEVSAQTPITDPNGGKFQIVLDSVNFQENPSIQFELELTWDVSQDAKAAAQAAYQQKVAQFQELERREAHRQYVELVRERIKLASRIEPRDVEALRGEERALVSGRIIQKLMEIAPDQTSPTVHVTAELIQQIFEVDKLLYFVAPYWWMPRKHWRPSPRPNPYVKPYRPPVAIRPEPPTGKERDTGKDGKDGDKYGKGSDKGPVKSGTSSSDGGNDGSTSGGTDVLTEDDLVGWDGLAPTDPRHGRYFITEDSAPAPMGASLGWLLQLDGDNHRNAFLNSPWVKVVLPIRPCMEMAALNWLTQAHVEGTEGLDEQLRQKIENLAQEICALSGDMQRSLATETVFETGFNPLEGGFRAPGTPQLPDGTPAHSGDPYVIFDQWIEVLPTHQVVAVEYKLEEHEGV